jgi:hypothetical protein
MTAITDTAARLKVLREQLDNLGFIDDWIVKLAEFEDEAADALAEQVKDWIGNKRTELIAERDELTDSYDAALNAIKFAPPSLSGGVHHNHFVGGDVDHNHYFSRVTTKDGSEHIVMRTPAITHAALKDGLAQGRHVDLEVMANARFDNGALSGTLMSRKFDPAEVVQVG